MTTIKRNTTDTNGIAQEFTFGVEIETTCPKTNRLRIGSYSSTGEQVPYLPEGWVAKSDCSIRTEKTGHIAVEIVSPILKGESGIIQLIEVVRILKEKGHAVNSSCGVHVHVGFKGRSAEELAKLINVASYLEKGMYAITGSKRREQGSYCGSVKEHRNANAFKAAGLRYKLLNINNLTGRKETVEFRCFSGSLNATKIVGWVQVALGVVEKALTTKRMPKWDGKNPIGVWKKTGNGQTETERLLAYLCWVNRGKAPAHQRAYGWISNKISQKEIRKMFRKLAEQYDAQA
jgi:hypothetical protein